MAVKDLFDLPRLFTREELVKMTRNELITLTDLPVSFKLRDLPDFPSPETVAELIGNPFVRHTSEVTDEWGNIHKKIGHLPRIVQQTILSAWGKPQNRNNIFYGYGWSESEYVKEVKFLQESHALISEILDRNP